MPRASSDKAKPAKASASPDALERFYAPDRQAWRSWLVKHHAKSPGIWLIYAKPASGKTRVPYADAVEEALCFGWIDSRPGKIDAHFSMQLFTPRKPRSPWSKLNKQRVEKLEKLGLMTDAGRAKVELAKARGTWNIYDGIESLKVPPELAQALRENAAAEKNFDAFPPSSKKNILWWITSAKKPETRAARVKTTVEMAKKNLRANHSRQTKSASAHA